MVRLIPFSVYYYKPIQKRINKFKLQNSANLV